KNKITFKWKDASIVGVMLASKGYPGNYEKGKAVSGFDLNGNYFVSGLKRDKDKFVTNGGRVILALGEGNDIASAKANAYKAEEKIKRDRKSDEKGKRDNKRGKRTAK